jgi:hypothetical protein
VLHSRNIHRKSIACGIALTLLVPATSAAGGQDLRSPDARDAATRHKVATAPVASGQDLRSPDARDAARSTEIAVALRRYYSSHPEPAPVAAAPSTGTSHDSRWLTIALSVAATLAVVAISSTGLRRLRIRRRRAAVAS